MNRNSEQKVAKRREEILSAALTVFAEEGYHKAGIAQIARLLGIGHGTFYRYFANKHAIFLAIVDQVIEDLGQVVAEEDPYSSDSLQDYQNQLFRLGAALVSVFLADPRLGRILFYESMGAGPEVAAKVDEAMDLIAGYTAMYLLNGVQKGYLREDLDVEVSARMINAMVFECARQTLREEDPAEAAWRWTDGLVKMILVGMAAQPPEG